MKNLGDWLARDVITVAMVTEGDTTLEDLGIMEIEPGQTIIKCADVQALPYGMVDPQGFAAAMQLAGDLAGHARTLGDEKRAIEAENAKLRELVWVMHDWMARALHDKSLRRWEYDEIMRRMAELGFEVGA